MKLQWAGSQERNLASGRGGAFFLTSLFIEVIDPCKRVLSVNARAMTDCRPISLFSIHTARQLGEGLVVQGIAN
jgi:hypothetical protein